MNDDDIKGADIAREVRDARASMSATEHHARFNRLAFYKPSGPQAQFHACRARERLLVSGSQFGKTFAISRELAMHALNRYPKDWAGMKFDKPKPGLEKGAVTFLAWAGAPTSQMVRDGCQKRLLGDIEVAGMTGTEAIPASAIINIQKARGIAGMCDSVTIKRDPYIDPKTGEKIDLGVAVIRFKTFEQSRQAWQSESVDFVWIDEQPPDFALYKEAKARTNATRGVVAVSLTPLLGRDQLIELYENEGPDRQVIRMGLNSENMHYISEADKAARLEDYKDMDEGERQCRLFGVPARGEGAVYRTSASQITFPCGSFKTQPGTQYIGGMDFSHMGQSDQSSPAAFVIVAYDPHTGVAYVVDAWTLHRATISAQIERLWGHKIGQRIRWAWPQDGHQGSGSEDGASIMRRFKDAGVLMRPEHARTKTGSNWREDGVAVMREMMNDHLFYVSDHLTEWFNQYANYHYKDNRIVQSYCDLLDATRTAIVDLRFAKALSEYDQIPRMGRRSQPSRGRGVQIADGTSEHHFGID